MNKYIIACIQVPEKYIEATLIAVIYQGPSWGDIGGWRRVHSGTIVDHTQLTVDDPYEEFDEAYLAECLTLEETYLLFIDQIEEKVYELNREMIRKGVQAIAAKEPYLLYRLLVGLTDADFGDKFLQYCLFGEVKYE